MTIACYSYNLIAKCHTNFNNTNLRVLRVSGISTNEIK